jgi:hypothetical protein
MRALLLVSLLALTACTSRRPELVDSGAPGVDAGRAVDAAGPGPEDAGSAIDAGIDSGIGAPDAGPRDAGPSDGGLRDAGPRDAGPSDAGPSDAGPSDAGPPDAGAVVGSVRYECVPAVLPNESNPGMVLSADFWPGFRFEVPSGGLVVTAIGLNAESTTGTVFAALVRLPGPTGVPDLSGGDVIGTSLVDLGGSRGSVTRTAPLGVSIGPGWYAAVYGTGAFGASASSTTVHSNSGAGGCLGTSGFPFSIRQSDGMLILQAATPNLLVEGVAP